MPNYIYGCDSCGQTFELFAYIKDYNPTPACPNCRRKSHRLYHIDVLTQSASVKKSDSELKTLGDLADRNRDRMSNDQKEALKRKHNDYKLDKPDEPLPTGMSRIKKPPKTKWTKK